MEELAQGDWRVELVKTIPGIGKFFAVLTAQKDAELRAYYERVRVKKGANSAKIATARRLAMIVYRVLSRRRAYKVYGLRSPSRHLSGSLERGRTET